MPEESEKSCQLSNPTPDAIQTNDQVKHDYSKKFRTVKCPECPRPIVGDPSSNAITSVLSHAVKYHYFAQVMNEYYDSSESNTQTCQFCNCRIQNNCQNIVQHYGVTHFKVYDFMLDYQWKNYERCIDILYTNSIKFGMKQSFLDNQIMRSQTKASSRAKERSKLKEQSIAGLLTNLNNSMKRDYAEENLINTLLNREKVADRNYEERQNKYKLLNHVMHLKTSLQGERRNNSLITLLLNKGNCVGKQIRNKKCHLTGNENSCHHVKIEGTANNNTDIPRDAFKKEKGIKYWSLTRQGYTKKGHLSVLNAKPWSVPNMIYGGRGPACQLRCKAGNISRKHFQLTCQSRKGKMLNTEAISQNVSADGCQWTIRDLGSKTGTYLNGKKLEGDEEVTMNDRDLISVGGNFSNDDTFNQKYIFVYQVVAPKQSKNA